MSISELSTLTVAFASAITGIVAAYIACQANKSNKEIAKRQGVIDLHVQWNGINDLNLENIVVPDIVKAVNALTLTASLWNHDVVIKPIIYQSYWQSYRTLYDKLYAHDEEIKGLDRTGKSMMTEDITKAYHSMRTAKIDKLLTTKY